MLSIEKLKSNPASLGQAALTGVFLAIPLVMVLQAFAQWDESRDIREHRAGIQQATDDVVQRVREGRHLQ